MYTKNTATSPEPSVQLPFPGKLQPGQDIVEYAKQYARQRPDVAALWCFGIGFIVGWKLKPW